eukprot:1614786-Amphidinium_carterae.1
MANGIVKRCLSVWRAWRGGPTYLRAPSDRHYSFEIDGRANSSGNNSIALTIQRKTSFQLAPKWPRPFGVRLEESGNFLCKLFCTSD